MEAPRSWEYTSVYDKKYISSFPRRYYFRLKSNFAFSFSLSSDSWIVRTEIHFADRRKLFRVAEKYRWVFDGSYTCGAGQRIDLEAERNHLIKMLIARLVRRPPAMSARSSAGVASRGVCEYLPLNLRPFSRFPFLSFFIYFAGLFIARWIVYAITCRIWIMLSLSISFFFSLILSCFLDRRELTANVM